jgi:hypothetical protein
VKTVFYQHFVPLGQVQIMNVILKPYSLIFDSPPFGRLERASSRPEIKYMIQTIITGDTGSSLGRTHPDVEPIDLGLVTWNSDKGFTIANPVYEEILTRYLNSGNHKHREHLTLRCKKV